MSRELIDFTENLFLFPILAKEKQEEFLMML